MINPSLRTLFRSHSGQAARPLIWLIGFFAFLNIYPIQAVLPLVMRDFQASPISAGMTVGIAVLGMAVMSPFVGMLSDALGRKLILCGSMLLVALPTALIAATESMSALLVLRFFQGIAVPGVMVATIAYLSEEFQVKDVPRMTALYIGGGVMGGFFGRFFTGHAADLFGWRGAFVALAVLNFVGAIVVLWLLPPSRAFVASRDVKGALRTLGRHLRNRALLATCAVGFCIMFAMVGMFTYVSLYLATPPFNLSARGIANVFLVYLVGTVVTPFAGRYIAEFGLPNSLLTTFAISASGVMLTLVPALLPVIAGLIIFSCGVFICQSITMTSIGACVSEGRSLAMGIFNLIYYAGGAVSTLLVGLPYQRYGWTAAIFAIVVIQISACAIAYLTWRKRLGQS